MTCRRQEERELIEPVAAVAGGERAGASGQLVELEPPAISSVGLAIVGQRARSNPSSASIVAASSRGSLVENERGPSPEARIGDGPPAPPRDELGRHHGALNAR
jgi:hypothetical protein